MRYHYLEHCTQLVYSRFRLGCHIDDGMLSLLCRALRYTPSLVILELDCMPFYHFVQLGADHFTANSISDTGMLDLVNALDCVPNLSVLFIFGQLT